jgi:LPXTG-site transpeptidase (sortase) family protein
MKTWFKKYWPRLVLVLVVMIGLNINLFLHNFMYTFLGRKTIYNNPAIVVPNQVAKANTLWIEALRVEAPVVYVDKADENIFQEALQRGVVHYPGTAKPGELGNVYIFGHSSDYVWAKGSYKTVFALLPKIQKGEEIKVSNEQGEVFTYVVKESFVASAKDLHLLSQREYKQKILTLQTSYPIGTALKRWIIVAELK